MESASRWRHARAGLPPALGPVGQAKGLPKGSFVGWWGHQKVMCFSFPGFLPTNAAAREDTSRFSWVRRPFRVLTQEGVTFPFLLDCLFLWGLGQSLRMPLNSLVLWAFLTLPFKGPFLPWGCHWLISMPVVLKWYPPHTHHLLLHIPPRAVSRFEAYLHWGFSFQFPNALSFLSLLFLPGMWLTLCQLVSKGVTFPPSGLRSPPPGSCKISSLSALGIFF